MGIREYQNNLTALVLSGCALFTLSFVPGFSVVIFVAFVPLLLLVDRPINPVNVYVSVVVTLVCIFGLTFIPGPWKITGIFYFGLLVTTIFSVYISAQRLTQNRLNKFSLLILLVASEYLLLKFLAHKNPYFLADTFQEHSTWLRWNIYTGYLGASFWILLINLLIYEGVKASRINYFLLVLAAMTTIMPVIYSKYLPQNGLTKADVIAFYTGIGTGNTDYNEYGELISRTGVWVSILIIIFTLIRIKTKKVAR